MPQQVLEETSAAGAESSNMRPENSFRSEHVSQHKVDDASTTCHSRLVPEASRTIWHKEQRATTLFTLISNIQATFNT